MKIVIFVVFHWYIGLFLQSFFLHRYSAHKHFTMSQFWERLFFVLNFLVFGSSYMSPYAFGILHQTHHAHADSELDPHSPNHSKGFLDNLIKTRNNYRSIYLKYQNDDTRKSKFPHWEAFDHFAHNWMVRIGWMLVYIMVYMQIATSYWQFLFLPITITMSALQGAIVNWWAHRIGYRNYNTPDMSKNIIPIDLFFVGEAFHNNHHKYPNKVNSAIKYFEIDWTYQIIKLMHLLKIIRIRKRAQ